MIFNFTFIFWCPFREYGVLYLILYHSTVGRVSSSQRLLDPLMPSSPPATYKRLLDIIGPTSRRIQGEPHFY